MTVIAEFPLGVFQGREEDGSTRASYPDAARLHGALVHAAGKGLLAEERDGDLRPSAASIKALTWLEEHPPVALAIPEHVATHPNQVITSWRDEGVLDKKTKKKRSANLRCRTALASPMAWLWDDVPDDVQTTIAALVPDVSCLGEADSPVVLTMGEMEPTHYFDPTASEFTRGRLTAHRCPVPGRFAALEADYERLHPRKVGASKAPLSNESMVSPGNVGFTRSMRYRPVVEETTAVPWRQVWVFDTGAHVPEQERVTASVAFHRMLAARLGDDASAWITGAYAQGVNQPSNRVAIQVVDRDRLPHLNLRGDPFLVLIPEGMDALSLQQLDVACMGRLHVYTSRRDLWCTRTTSVDGAEFWPAPEPGTKRLWRPQPAMVSETRRQPDRDGEAWTLAHAALLSLGFVTRDLLGPVDQTAPRYWGIVDAVRAAGVRIVTLHTVTDSHADRYVHKAPRGMYQHGRSKRPAPVIQPFDARFDLAELVPEQAILAVGQARHLGGGLLVPVDVPIDRVEKGLS